MSPPDRSRPTGERRRPEPPNSPFQDIYPLTQAHDAAREGAYPFTSSGGVAEWSIAPVLKTGVRSRGPWVRIPPPPLALCGDGVLLRGERLPRVGAPAFP